MKTKTRGRGVTLIELLTAIAVLAILSAIAVPGFERLLERRRVTGAVDNIAAALQFAKSEAIKQNRRVAVQFNAAAWCIGTDDEPGSACDCKDSPSNCTVNGAQRTIPGADFDGTVLAVAGFGATTIQFDPRRGMPMNGNVPISDGTLTVTASHGFSRAVQLTSTGRIRIQ